MEGHDQPGTSMVYRRLRRRLHCCRRSFGDHLLCRNKDRTTCLAPARCHFLIFPNNVCPDVLQVAFVRFHPTTLTMSLSVVIVSISVAVCVRGMKVGVSETHTTRSSERLMAHSTFAKLPTEFSRSRNVCKSERTCRPMMAVFLMSTVDSADTGAMAAIAARFTVCVCYGESAPRPYREERRWPESRRCTVR